MHNVIRLLKWMVKAAIFFTLFAFALNNEHAVTLHFFFGRQWQAPLVLVVLLTFSIGVAVGVLGMIPWRWQQRRQIPPQTGPAAPAASPAPGGAGAAPLTQPAYSDGL